MIWELVAAAGWRWGWMVLKLNLFNFLLNLTDLILIKRIIWSWAVELFTYSVFRQMVRYRRTYSWRDRRKWLISKRLLLKKDSLIEWYGVTCGIFRAFFIVPGIVLSSFKLRFIIHFHVCHWFTTGWSWWLEANFRGSLYWNTRRT